MPRVWMEVLGNHHDLRVAAATNPTAQSLTLSEHRGGSRWVKARRWCVYAPVS